MGDIIHPEIKVGKIRIPMARANMSWVRPGSPILSRGWNRATGDGDAGRYRGFAIQ